MLAFRNGSITMALIVFTTRVGALGAQSGPAMHRGWATRPESLAGRLVPPRVAGRPNETSPPKCGNHALTGAVAGALLGLVVGPLALGYGDADNGHRHSLALVAVGSTAIGGVVGGLLGATAKRCSDGAT